MAHPLNAPELIEKWRQCVVSLERRELAVTVAPADFGVLTYLDAWNHLMPFVRLMGAPFVFVEMDLNKNLGNLRAHHQTAAATNAAHIDALMHGIFEWEWSQVRSGEELNPDGPVRIVQRLNRALHFVELLIEAMEKSATCDLTAEAKVAYEKTMSPTHGWAVRTAVGLALYAIPDTKTFLERINVKHPEERQTLVDLRDSIRHVRSHFGTYFETKKITHLP